jgi:hypothetical protein
MGTCHAQGGAAKNEEHLWVGHAQHNPLAGMKPGRGFERRAACSTVYTCIYGVTGAQRQSERNKSIILLFF